MANIVAGGGAVSVDSLNIDSSHFNTNFDAYTITLSDQLTQLALDFMLDYIAPTIGYNELNVYSIGIARKPYVLRGSDIFSFSGYNGFYSLDGITKIDESRAKYRYVFYVYSGLSLDAVLLNYYNVIKNGDSRNPWLFAYMLGLGANNPWTMDFNVLNFKNFSESPKPPVNWDELFPDQDQIADIGGYVVDLSKDVVDLDKGVIPDVPTKEDPDLSLIIPTVVYNQFNILWTPVSQFHRFFGGSLSSINLGGTNYQYMSGVSAYSNTFPCITDMANAEYYQQSQDLLWRFGSDMKSYSSLGDSNENEKWATQYAIPWGGCTIGFNSSSVNVDLRLPSLILKNNVNILPRPFTGYLNWSIIANRIQCFNVVFPGLELLQED